MSPATRRADSGQFINFDDYRDDTLPSFEFLIPDAPPVVYEFLREVREREDRLQARLDCRHVHGHLFGTLVVYVEERVVESPGRRICFSMTRTPMRQSPWELYDVVLHPEGVRVHIVTAPEPDMAMLHKMIDEFMEPYR